MSFRISIATAAAIVCLAVSAVPASAAMQITPMPDPNAPQQAAPPDGLFDKSVPDTWQKKSSDSTQQNLGTFHFTVSGSAGGAYNTTDAPSAYDTSKRPGSEFYQPMPGEDPFTGRTNQDPFAPR